MTDTNSDLPNTHLPPFDLEKHRRNMHLQKLRALKAKGMLITNRAIERLAELEGEFAQAPQNPPSQP
jgi:hypothetical protein